jgi:hypothetical protein
VNLIAQVIAQMVLAREKTGRVVHVYRRSSVEFVTPTVLTVVPTHVIKAPVFASISVIQVGTNLPARRNVNILDVLNVTEPAENVYRAKLESMEQIVH